jgi:uncharacterized protein (TIGR03437 family)
MYFERSLTALLVCAWSLSAATFGSAVSLVGGASDLVLDEARGRLYLVNSTQGRVEVYSLAQRRFLNPVGTDATPISAAISRNGKSLYVTSYDASSLNIIDLDALTVKTRISLAARPEGVAVGNDERVLISTIGTGAGNLANVLLLYDPNASNTVSVIDIAVTPPPPTPPTLPAPSGRPFLASRSQLMASRDGSIIVGANIPAASTTLTVFVYETASATVLRSRNVASASSVLSVAPDNSKFMAGLNLFDATTLQILAQQNLANSPYPIAPTTNFNTQSSQGGSVFAPDGTVVYSGFDVSPVQNPPARANVSQLMLSDPDNLLIGMGLQLPENLAGKMVLSSDGGNLYALSESGFTIIPISTMRQFPIAVPDSTVAALAYDQCGVTTAQRTARITVKNAGRGTMSANAQVLQYTATGPGGIGGAGGAGGGTPGGGVVIVLPPSTGGAAGTIAQTAPAVRTQQTTDGTALDFSFNSQAARGLGTISPSHDFLIQSSQAINIPQQIRIYQNNRNAEARGDLIPVEVGISSNDALEDLAYDSNRQRIYIANSGRNRIEVFDARQKKFGDSIKVGQLPRSIALSPDGGTLYVANTGGESISIVDTTSLQVIGRVTFPPIPINAASALVTASVIVAHQGGAMFLSSTGQLWDIIGSRAVPRAASPVIGVDAQGRPLTIPAPRSMAATPNGERVIILSGTGFVYLYDALTNNFIQSRQIFTGTQTGYYGPITAGPRGQYYVVNGTVLNEALTPVNTGAATGGTVAGTASASATTFVRFNQTARANANTLPPDAGSFDVVDVTSGLSRASIPALEGPLTQVVGAARTTIGGRIMAVDPSGSTVYAISTTGLSVIPLDPPSAADRPVVSARGAVNLGSYQASVAPNTLLSIFGRNLTSSTATASSIPLPTQLGGVCVTLGTTALPLFAALPGQINAQIPPELATGNYQLVVRSIDKKVASASQALTLSKYAPAVLVDPSTNQILLFHADGRPVTKENRAHRDEPLVMYALGLGATKGGKASAGVGSPASPLAETDPVEVFFGNPLFKQAGIIVDWSGLTPGYVGLYQMNLRVPGFHISGDALPVMLKIGNVSSPTSGPLVPVVAVE